jgi:hypothetical protein
MNKTVLLLNYVTPLSQRTYIERVIENTIRAFNNNIKADLCTAPPPFGF